MISVDEARARLFAAAKRPGCELVSLAEATGRVTATDIVAKRTQPPFAASAMDGYAVRAADTHRVMRVVGEAAAGRDFAGQLGPAEAVRIFTGAPVPSGADAILIQEDAEADGTRLSATAPVRPGDHIRPHGLDFSTGDVLLTAGTRLASRHVALAGAGGHAAVPVMRRPKVAFLATGDELKAPGEPTGPNDIVASVTPALAALVAAAGGSAIDLGIVPDQQSVIAERARNGLMEADILVTLGGASVGAHDLVRPALADLGVTLDFWRVAVRPGKPLMFASNPLVLGLPGNPVSGQVCTILFLAPLVEAMVGLPPGPIVRPAVLGADLPQNGSRQDHMRARTYDDGRVVPFPAQDSSMLRVMADADCLIVRPPSAPAVAAGSPCSVIPLA